MQTSSNEKNLPNQTHGNDVIRVSEDWTVMTALLNEQSQLDYAGWLDDQLRGMEKDLDRFVGARSRFSGRR